MCEECGKDHNLSVFIKGKMRMTICSHCLKAIQPDGKNWHSKLIAFGAKQETNTR